MPADGYEQLPPLQLPPQAWPKLVQSLFRLLSTWQVPLRQALQAEVQPDWWPDGYEQLPPLQLPPQTPP